ncbi:MAG: DUF1844 domain-containing protein, partial [Myxococcota bacterium]
PELDFTTFVMSIVGTALVHLGDAPDPDKGALETNLVLARQNVQLLTMLAEKTKGNLDGEEERILNQGLDDLRHRLLEVAKES